MRLIDADKMTKDIEQAASTAKKKFQGRRNGKTLLAGYLAGLDCGRKPAEEQQIAYDTNKVIEELKDSAIEFEAFGICSDYVELTTAIDIVKGGGADGI